jgi:hypothetical protein
MRLARRGGPEARATSLTCQLDIGAHFCFDGSVSADDQVTSLTGVGGRAHNGPIAFTTTNWSVVLKHKANRRQHKRRSKNFADYWRPVYSFIRREGTGPEKRKI